MTNESTKQPLGLAFLSWDLCETRPVYVNRAVPNALRQEGKMGLLAGLHAHGFCSPNPGGQQTSCKRRREKKKSSVNPAAPIRDPKEFISPQ